MTFKTGQIGLYSVNIKKQRESRWKKHWDKHKATISLINNVVERHINIFFVKISLAEQLFQYFNRNLKLHMELGMNRMRLNINQSFIINHTKTKHEVLWYFIIDIRISTSMSDIQNYHDLLANTHVKATTLGMHLWCCSSSYMITFPVTAW